MYTVYKAPLPEFSPVPAYLFGDDKNNVHTLRRIVAHSVVQQQQQQQQVTTDFGINTRFPFAFVRSAVQLTGRAQHAQTVPAFIVPSRLSRPLCREVNEIRIVQRRQLNVSFFGEFVYK